MSDANIYIGPSCPSFLARLIVDAVAVDGPVTVYGSEENRWLQHVERVASAAKQEAWQHLTERSDVGPSRDEEHATALKLLQDAATYLAEREAID